MLNLVGLYFCVGINRTTQKVLAVLLGWWHDTPLKMNSSPRCVQARSSNPRGRACEPSGKGSREEGILSGVVPVYLYCPAFNVSVSLGV